MAVIEDADGVGEVGNPQCGDIFLAEVQAAILVDRDKFLFVRFLRQWRPHNNNIVAIRLRASCHQAYRIDFQRFSLIQRGEETRRHLELENVSVFWIGWMKEIVPLVRELLS